MHEETTVDNTTNNQETPATQQNNETSEETAQTIDHSEIEEAVRENIERSRNIRDEISNELNFPYTIEQTDWSNLCNTSEKIRLISIPDDINTNQTIVAVKRQISDTLDHYWTLHAVDNEITIPYMTGSERTVVITQSYSGKDYRGVWISQEKIYEGNYFHLRCYVPFVATHKKIASFQQGQYVYNYTVCKGNELLVNNSHIDRTVDLSNRHESLSEEDMVLIKSKITRTSLYQRWRTVNHAIDGLQVLMMDTIDPNYMIKILDVISSIGRNHGAHQ